MRFLHGGLKRFERDGDQRGILPAHAARLKRLLSTLKSARSPRDVHNRTLHVLRAGYLGCPIPRYSVRVSGQWRLVFDFKDGAVNSVDYLNYH